MMQIVLQRASAPRSACACIQPRWIAATTQVRKEGRRAMRITALAVAMLLAFGVARTTLGQAPAGAKNLGITAQNQQASSGASLMQRRMAAQAACVAANQPQSEAQAFASQGGAVQQ